MPIKQFFDTDQLTKDPCYPAFQDFLDQWADDHFFQSPEFLEFIRAVDGYKPFLLVSCDESGRFKGSLLAVLVYDGNGIKSWFSRRLIVWGGPVVANSAEEEGRQTAQDLLKALKNRAFGKAIYIEFRNYFDTAALRPAFESRGFTFRDHLNFLVRLDDEASVQKRMGSNRKRQIRISLEAGAEIREPENEGEVRQLYDILDNLYREKVKKPLPGFGLFRQFWASPNGKAFVVVYNGKVMGGAAGPVYRNKIIYQWYVCGDNSSVKGLHSSVLATWAQMEYGLKNGYRLFDFMGAGRPDEAYGVREFKARFGGDEVSYGRYELILNPVLYQVGKFGLKFYYKLKKAV